MRRDFYVYVLFRHDTGIPFWIGKGTGKRFEGSANGRGDLNLHKKRIIAKAKRDGKEIPRVKIVANISESQAFVIERALIDAIGRYPDGPLANVTNGGGGTSGYRYERTPEILAKLSASQTIRLLDPAARKAAGAKNIGRKRSPECAAKQKANNPGNTGHRHSEEAIAKIRAARAVQIVTDADRRKMSESATIAWARRKGELP